MIASEREYIKTETPGLEQLRNIKEASLVISPDEIVSKVFVNSNYIAYSFSLRF